MTVFHSDLDNTLIYSYKHDIGPDKVCVEMYQGREQSFMDREWIRRLRNIQSRSLFVPTTTRTVEQYKRIDMKIDPPAYALVCNGGVLLVNGQRDESWYKESLDSIAGAADELKRSIELLEKDERRSFEVRFIDQLFIFTKSSNPEKTIRYCRQNLDPGKVDVFSNGPKVYVLPRSLSKGQAVLRFKQRVRAERLIAAGDSSFDIPMLLASDAGLCPKGLFDRQHKNIMQFPAELFTGEMLGRVESLL